MNAEIISAKKIMDIKNLSKDFKNFQSLNPVKTLTSDETIRLNKDKKEFG